MMTNTAKNFGSLSNFLSVLHNYFNMKILHGKNAERLPKDLKF